MKHEEAFKYALECIIRESGFTKEQLLSKNRHLSVVRARSAVIELCLRAGMTHEEASFFMERDRVTITHAKNHTIPSFAQDVFYLKMVNSCTLSGYVNNR